MSKHRSPCCDPARMAKARASVNAALPGNGRSSVGGNRFKNPSAPKPRKGVSAKAKREISQYFKVKDKDIPVLDGKGNFLGFLAPGRPDGLPKKSSEFRGVKINWGQIKRMPEFDLSRIDVDPRDRLAKETAKSVQYVYVFATAMYCDASFFKGFPWSLLPVSHYERKSGPLKGERVEMVRTGISGWIPRSALAGKKGGPVRRVLDCSQHCMSQLRKKRIKTGKKLTYEFVDLDRSNWTTAEWWRAGSFRDRANAAHQKEWGGYHLEPGAPEPKLSVLDVIIRQDIENNLDPHRKDHDKKFARELEGFLLRAPISAGKSRGGDGSMKAGDYFARRPAVPPVLRLMNFLWAVPGEGGVSMDSFPLGHKFHRIVAIKSRSPVYRLPKKGSGEAIETGKRLTWYYGFVTYPTGAQKVKKKNGKGTKTVHGEDRVYGWVLKNCVKRKPKKP